MALFLDQEMIKAVDFTLYTDVTATVGYSSFYRWFQGRWPPELMLKDNEQLSMAFFKLYPIVVSAILWGEKWKSKTIFSTVIMKLLSLSLTRVDLKFNLLWHSNLASVHALGCDIT